VTRCGHVGLGTSMILEECDHHSMSGNSVRIDERNPRPGVLYNRCCGAGSRRDGKVHLKIETWLFWEVTCSSLTIYLTPCCSGTFGQSPIRRALDLVIEAPKAQAYLKRRALGESSTTDPMSFILISSVSSPLRKSSSWRVVLPSSRRCISLFVPNCQSQSRIGLQSRPKCHLHERNLSLLLRVHYRSSR
jgi:hypothetical protein